MKVIFIDHKLHIATSSSVFFQKLLGEHFEVDIHYVDPDHPETILGLTVDSNADVVVLWQADFLAPIFLAQGRRTVVVPMYDGSANLPDIHWLWAMHASFINFSLRLHNRIRRLGHRSMLVKYFEAPVDEARRARFSGLRAFLWQRRPEEGINLAKVERLFGDQLRSLHVHDAPDNKKIDTAQFLQPSRTSYKLSVSKWFDCRAEYYERLDRCNVFISPRRSEGIGIAFLEAMSRGMLVVAAGYPTHDEYIANWVNGVLFDPDGDAVADFSNAEQMGYLAWRTTVDGYGRWMEQRREIVEFIQTTPAPPLNVRLDPDRIAAGLLRAYGAGADAYCKYLIRNAPIIQRIADVQTSAALTPGGDYDPEHYSHFGDATLPADVLVGSGFYPAETDGKAWWRWTGPGGVAEIRIPIAGPGSYRVAMWCERATPGVLESLSIRCCTGDGTTNVTDRNGSASVMCEAHVRETGFTGWLDLELRHRIPERSEDGRMLGLCLGSIQVEEFDAALDRWTRSAMPQSVVQFQDVSSIGTIHHGVVESRRGGFRSIDGLRPAASPDALNGEVDGPDGIDVPR